MQLARCNPRSARRGHNNTPSLFDEILTPFFYHPSTPATSAQMAVDIFDKEEQIVIEAELVGIEKDNIKVDVKGKQLTISAERKLDEEIKDEQRYRRERKHGKVERSFALSFEVAEDQVEAKYENGLLTLTISKPEEQQKKQIKIN